MEYDEYVAAVKNVVDNLQQENTSLEKRKNLAINRFESEMKAASNDYDNGRGSGYVTSINSETDKYRSQGNFSGANRESVERFNERIKSEFDDLIDANNVQLKNRQEALKAIDQMKENDAKIKEVDDKIAKIEEEKGKLESEKMRFFHQNSYETYRGDGQYDTQPVANYDPQYEIDNLQKQIEELEENKKQLNDTNSSLLATASSLASEIGNVIKQKEEAAKLAEEKAKSTEPEKVTGENTKTSEPAKQAGEKAKTSEPAKSAEKTVKTAGTMPDASGKKHTPLVVIGNGGYTGEKNTENNKNLPVENPSKLVAISAFFKRIFAKIKDAFSKLFKQDHSEEDELLDDDYDEELNDENATDSKQNEEEKNKEAEKENNFKEGLKVSVNKDESAVKTEKDEEMKKMKREMQKVDKEVSDSKLDKKNKENLEEELKLYSKHAEEEKSEREER